MEFYVYRDGKQLGPYPLEALQDMLRLGSISSEDLAWCDGLTDWQPLRALLADLPHDSPPIPQPGRIPTASAGAGVRRGGGASAAATRPDAAELSFPAHLVRAFGYPLRRDGLIFVVGGGLLNALPGFLGLVPLAALLIQLFVSGYMAAYVQRIIQSSAAGEEDLPKWPDFSNLLDDLIAPLLQLLATVMVCITVPMWLVRASAGSGSDLVCLSWAYLVIGALCLPMALLGVTLYDSLAALNPLLILRSIARIPGPYVLALLVLILLISLERSVALAFRSVRIPILSSLVEGCFGFYFLAVVMRVVGVLYWANRARLGWFRSR